MWKQRQRAMLCYLWLITTLRKTNMFISLSCDCLRLGGNSSSRKLWENRQNVLLQSHWLLSVCDLAAIFCTTKFSKSQYVWVIKLYSRLHTFFLLPTLYPPWLALYPVWQQPCLGFNLLEYTFEIEADLGWSLRCFLSQDVSKYTVGLGKVKLEEYEMPATSLCVF